MNPDDSFDFDEFKAPTSLASTTAWSRFGSKKTIRRTYGRRGSDAGCASSSDAGRQGGFSAISFFSSSVSTLSENQEGDAGEMILAEEAEWEHRSRRNSASSHSPSFPCSDANLTPPIPIRKLVARAHSVTGASPQEPSSSISRPSPTLKRSSSVSTYMSSGRNSLSSTRNSSSSFLSASDSSSLGCWGSRGIDCENADPNYYAFDNGVSPKRFPANLDGNARGRKKIRPISHQQDFLPASSDFPTLGKARNCNTVVPSKSEAATDSFSILAHRHGEPLAAWAGTPLGGAAPSPMGMGNPTTPQASPIGLFASSPPFAGDSEDDDEVATICSPASNSMASSTRKRGLSASPLSEGGSPPPVPRVKSRMFSPLPSAPLASESSMLLSVDSRRSHLMGSNLMDVSLYPSSSNKKDRPIMDVMISDDDANVADESVDDISLDSGDNKVTVLPISQSYRSRKATAGNTLRVLVPDRASVDDVIESMSSYDDVLFLVNSLDKEKEKGVAVLSWCVVPRSEWDANRRNSFFTWTLGPLGFALDSAGCDVKYVKIPKMKGEQLLTLLRSTLNACKERGMGATVPSRNEQARFPIEFTFSPVQMSKQTSASTTKE